MYFTTLKFDKTTWNRYRRVLCLGYFSILSKRLSSVTFEERNILDIVQSVVVVARPRVLTERKNYSIVRIQCEHDRDPNAVAFATFSFRFVRHVSVSGRVSRKFDFKFLHRMFAMPSVLFRLFDSDRRWTVRRVHHTPAASGYDRANILCT